VGCVEYGGKGRCCKSRVQAGGRVDVGKSMVRVE